MKSCVAPLIFRGHYFQCMFAFPFNMAITVFCSLNHDEKKNKTKFQLQLICFEPIQYKFHPCHTHILCKKKLSFDLAISCNNLFFNSQHFQIGLFVIYCVAIRLLELNKKNRSKNSIYMYVFEQCILLNCKYVSILCTKYSCK